MEADRTELHDLASLHPEVVARLEAAWKAWQARAFVDEWPGPDHTNWGQDILPAAEKGETRISKPQAADPGK